MDSAQDIGPNSISNICNFQVVSEVYLQQEPTVELFREFYYLNRQTEFTDGPSLELGDISIQRWKEATFQPPNCPVIPRTGTKLGFTAKTLLQKGKILCRVIVPTGLAISTLFQTASAQQNGKIHARLFKDPSLNGQQLDRNRPGSMLGRMENFALKLPPRLNVQVHRRHKRPTTPLLDSVD